MSTEYLIYAVTLNGPTGTRVARFASWHDAAEWARARAIGGAVYCVIDTSRHGAPLKARYREGAAQ